MSLQTLDSRDSNITKGLYLQHRIAYGTLALLGFDIFLTFKDEITYVWARGKGPWSLFKTLYLVCRYFPLVIPCLLIAPPLNSQKYCGGLEWFLFFGTTMLCVLPLDCLLCIRLHNLFASKTMRRITVSSLIFEAITFTILNVFNAKSNDLTIYVVPQISWKACIYQGHTSLGSLISVGIPPLVIAFLYFCFAIVAFYDHLRQRETLTKHRLLRESGSLAPILTVLFRNGVFCYVQIIVAQVATLIFFRVFSQSILLTVVPLLLATTSSIIGSRLVLILKGDPGHGTGIYRTGNELQIANSDDGMRDTESREHFPLEVLCDIDASSG